MNRHIGATLFMLGAALMSTPFAAPPSINLQDDPRTHACPSSPVGSMKAAGAAKSADGDAAYEAAFDPIAWTGSIEKRRIGFDGQGNGALQLAEWDAADALAIITPQARHIYTSDSRNATIPFEWRHLGTSQKSMLNTSPVTNKIDQLGAQRAQYLRGDRSLEQGNLNGMFRPRRKLLGAIVNSMPVFAGPPSRALLEPDYAAFYERYHDRPAAVFAGADDGMLHAFDASNGRELFAYIPRALFPALTQLTRPDFMPRAYVDGPIGLGEARVGSEWKTLLIAAMRGGAQGVFALDVTNASHFDEGAGVLWEFTDADDPHMGNVIGTPVIAKFYIGMRKGLPSYRYFAVVSAGLNNYVDDGASRFDADASNALFLLALDKPPAEKWKIGSNYFKFMLPAGDADLANGLGTPAVIADSQGVARHVYVGDLQGNVWRFDFTGIAPWKSATGAGIPKPIFIATDGRGNRQAISARPAVVFAPDGYLLLFGTGRLLESRDLQTAEAGRQSFYGVWDSPDKRGETTRRDRLMKRNLLARADGGFDIAGAAFAYGAAVKGWYIDFTETGERVLTAADLTGHTAYFDTVLPSADPCRPSIGRSYVVDTRSGLPPDNVVSGIPFDPDHTYGSITVPVSTDIIPRDATGKRKIRSQRIRVTDAGGTAPEKSASTSSPPIEQITTAGRLSWRELVDWDDENAKK